MKMRVGAEKNLCVSDTYYTTHSTVVPFEYPSKGKVLKKQRILEAFVCKKKGDCCVYVWAEHTENIRTERKGTNRNLT